MNDKSSDSDLLAQRRARLDELRRAGKAYPNDLRRDPLVEDLACEKLRDVAMMLNGVKRILVR